jgi:ferredoxin-NADP reductase
MMPDEHAAENATSEFERDELVGLVGNAFIRQGLSPPSQLHSAAKRWPGLTHREILDVLEQHFAEHRHLYTCGSGDGHFWMVEAAVRRKWQEKHPPRPHVDEELERPRRTPRWWCSARPQCRRAA